MPNCSRPPRRRNAWLAPLRTPVAFIALLALAFLAACAPSAASSGSHLAAPPAVTATSVTLPSAAYTADVSHDVAYGPLDGETLDLCVPHAATSARPGVVLIHGGAWSGGDKSMYADFCRLLAEHGFVAAAINYRLAPASPWPAQIVDAQLAVRWLRASAAHMALDPKRLCTYGDSAGGHLAVYLGSDATIHSGDEASRYPTQSSKVSCVVDAFGPVDLTLTGASPLQQSILRTLFGGASLADDPAAYRDASPLYLVSRASAPTLIIQGAQDTLVPPSQSLALQAALQQAGVSVQYLSYNGDHAFAGLSTQQIEGLILQAGIFLTAQEHP